MSDFFASYGALIGTFAGALVVFFGGRYLNRASATKTLVDTAMGFVNPLNKKVEDLEKLTKTMELAITAAQDAAEAANDRAVAADARAAVAESKAQHAVEQADRANKRADVAETHLRQAVDILTQRQIPVPAEWTVAS